MNQAGAGASERSSLKLITRKKPNMRTKRTKTPAMIFKQLAALVLFALAVQTTQGQFLQIVHSFPSGGGTEGYEPEAGLIQGTDGKLYGTTSGGPTSTNRGTVFSITFNGTLTTLVEFLQAGTGPKIPTSSLVQGTNGNYYGTTQNGGSGGSIFEMTPDGSVTVRAYFYPTNGAFPYALVQSRDGNFYGTTQQGGTNGGGTVFQITPGGLLTTLFHLKTGDLIHGWFPSAGLVEASDGNFYGVTQYGGPASGSDGTVFRITRDGTFTTLAYFMGTNGASPYSALVQGTNGDLYGTTQAGGIEGGCCYGTVFKVSTNGVISLVVSFTGTNGADPRGGLMLASDGNFYGTTLSDGAPANGKGTVFRMTHDGILTTLGSFDPLPAQNPLCRLVEASDGNFYGTTSAGGGTVFRLVMHPSLSTTRSGNQLVVSWPTNAVGFTLQSTTVLTPPTTWLDYPNLPAISGSQYTVTNTLPGNVRFFRLKK